VTERINRSIRLDFEQRARAVALEHDVGYLDGPYAAAAEIIWLRDQLLGCSMPIFRFAGWTLDSARRELRTPTSRVVPLPRTRFALLLAFARRPQRVLTRDQLMSAAQGPQHLVTERTIDVHISRLRSDVAKEFIRTVRGSGYLFVPDVVRAPLRGSNPPAGDLPCGGATPCGGT